MQHTVNYGRNFPVCGSYDQVPVCVDHATRTEQSMNTMNYGYHTSDYSTSYTPYTNQPVASTCSTDYYTYPNMENVEPQPTHEFNNTSQHACDEQSHNYTESINGCATSTEYPEASTV